MNNDHYHPDFGYQTHGAWDLPDLMALLGRGFFSHHEPHASVVGMPGEDRGNWVEQTTPYTCAVVSQEMILRDFGIQASEAQLTYEAAAHGWLTDHGTSIEDLANLLHLHGVSTHTNTRGSVEALVSELAKGHKVIAAVDSAKVWGTNSVWQELFSSHGADHALVVTGLDMRDSTHPQVYVNDPGDPRGAGKAYSLEQFLDGWQESGSFYVATDHAPPDLGQHSLFGANFNCMSGLYMDTGFWANLLLSFGRLAIEEIPSLRDLWHDGAVSSANPWGTMKDSDRNDLFMSI